MMRRLLVGTVAAAAALASAAAAPAGSNFFVGWTEDLPKEIGSQAVAPGAQLGGKAFRITLMWSPGQTSLTAADTTKLDRAVGSLVSARLRPVLSVYADAGSQAPRTATAREQYCTYVRNVLRRYSSLRDVVLWNEPNLSFFWAPQFNADGSSAAPADYQALAARCYDVLHSARPSVNVIGPVLSSNGNDNPGAASSVSHSPGNFIRRLGEAYRAGGRAKPLFDTFGHHAYGTDPWERPWRKHIGSKVIAEGDWNKLMSNLAEAFTGTAQPIPGQMLGTRPVSLWYLEGGHQTALDAGKAGYHGTENETGLIPDYAGGEPESPPPAETSRAPDQHTQALDAIRLAFCQPHVEAYFNFLLFDEPRLEGWQSGAFWADRTRKDSHGAFGSAIAAANARTVDCNALKGGRPSADYTPPSAPGGLTAVASASRVDLTWGASTDAAGPVAGYRVYRNGGFFSWTTGTAFADTSVKASTTYSYTVYAQDAASNLSAVSSKVTVTTPAADTYAAAVLADAPVAYWRLGDAAGTTAADERAAAPGTYLGGAALGAPGALAGDTDTSARFDGADDALSLPVDPGGGEGTLELWARPDDLGARNAIVYTADDGWSTYTHQVGVLADGRVRAYIWDGAVRVVESAPGTVTAGRWHHLVLTWRDGDALRLYVDGAVRGTSPLGQSWRSGNKLLAATGSGAGLSNRWVGGLDEIAVYAVALGEARIAAHWSRGRAAA